jgi:uncharacterized protein (TIGR00369 family)
LETDARTMEPRILTRILEEFIPFNRFLGVRTLELGDGLARLELPFRPELVGNPLRQALHGGVVSMLLDSTGGAAVWTQIRRDDLPSTIDLRIDYLRPARAEALIGQGRVVRLGNRVGVVELRAYHHGDEARPVAAGMGVYSIRRATGKDDAVPWRRVLSELETSS